jgi:hypothetical protein
MRPGALDERDEVLRRPPDGRRDELVEPAARLAQHRDTVELRERGVQIPLVLALAHSSPA